MNPNDTVKPVQVYRNTNKLTIAVGHSGLNIGAKVIGKIAPTL